MKSLHKKKTFRTFWPSYWDSHTFSITDRFTSKKTAPPWGVRFPLSLPTSTWWNFEEQAITTSSYEPRIWKRYVDDTFAILDRENVDVFLLHLNNQQPSIRFTMETEKDKKLALLDTAVLREPEGRLTTSVNRKPTHTDQYLAYDSHHPQSVKRGIVKCPYERAKRLVTKPSVIY